MIVLASQSASRKAMLEAAGVNFIARPAGLDERALESEMADCAPDEIALRLAKAKAQAIKSVDRPVLGSDSLVVVDGVRFDKPKDRDQAAEHLRFFSGREMQLYSAAVIALKGKTIWQHKEVARLHVRELSEQFIQDYLEAEWPEVGYCVGVFRMEARGVQLFERINGDHFTILGMPLLPVLGALRDIGELTK